MFGPVGNLGTCSEAFKCIWRYLGEFGWIWTFSFFPHKPGVGKFLFRDSEDEGQNEYENKHVHDGRDEIDDCFNNRCVVA